ncbi:coiled-coil domain-containing protein 55-domain containing protein [Phascolomyces articulosus]|uniref:Coiled-coil domain-containing protein 55-domain containing protein n=1 Tax=Phascolomyces articulosus TaxID=60185 RepID=A0AAD5K7Y6_9FUNG|nr:coiled-coil domain-containing protein 55-domain containing protein [Phascolomyces articulosus]
MKFGLNIAKSKQPRGRFTQRNAFAQDESEESGDDDQQQQQSGSSSSKKKNDKQQHKNTVNQQLSKTSTINKKIAEQHAKALEEDANIFDYDAVYDDLKQAEQIKKEALKGPETKKPKYIQGLLEMAEIRKKDRLLAEEKKVAREREAEGEEFADKEVFMTEAFKKQKEELQRIEAEERKREEEADKGKKMASFYKQVLDKKEAEREALIQHLKNKKEKETSDDKSNSAQKDESLDVELAKEAEREGKQVMLNDNNEIVDRRQLLGAGLNFKPKKFGSFGSLNDERAQERQREYDEYKRKKVEEYEARRRTGNKEERERFSQEIEKQMMETRQKEKEEEEQKQRDLEQKAATKRTTDDVAMSARERYLARKKQKLQQEAS